MKKCIAFTITVAWFLCLGIPITKAQNRRVIDSLSALHTRQLIVVITDNWNSVQGTLYAFSLHGHKWIVDFSNAVVVGSKGLGLGEGIMQLNIADAPVKHEGDLKAPAGIFSVGPAFGYTDAANANWIKNKYIKAADTVICVDDVHSAYYNTLLKTDTVKSDWNSFEYMHRKDNYYKWGLFVNHNANQTVAGKGSCIFMHIWENDHEGTEGCTAMQEADMLKILHWINARRNPLLIQLPKIEFMRLFKDWQLPALQ